MYLCECDNLAHNTCYASGINLDEDDLPYSTGCLGQVTGKINSEDGMVWEAMKSFRVSRSCCNSRQSQRWPEHLHSSSVTFDDSAGRESSLDRRSEPCARIKSSIHTRPLTSPYHPLTSLTPRIFIRR